MSGYTSPNRFNQTANKNTGAANSARKESDKESNCPLPSSVAYMMNVPFNRRPLNKDSLLAAFKVSTVVPDTLLSEDMIGIRSEEPKRPLNLNERHQYFHGDLIIEKYGKYKNYYKKTFNPQQIQSPFLASQIVEEDKVRVWIYIDEDDNF